jgi:hypothetical protein
MHGGRVGAFNVTSGIRDLDSSFKGAQGKYMTTHHINLSIGLNNTPAWAHNGIANVRPRDVTFSVGDTVVFQGAGGDIVLDFRGKSPFAANPNSPPVPRFVYESNGGSNLVLVVIEPRNHKYDFDCGIRPPGKSVVHLQAANNQLGDQFPVGT